ncbi:DUF2922 domain-containing protein [Atopococcus tabaci]|uniref:DUF2922 domain-containing protein n=1 Tax=Atopococcus tabaci TaxID=269774 RepID=UPI0003F6359D|nr:DUF2922 domain-containing protein [Atopococcus tabaci]
MATTLELKFLTSIGKNRTLSVQDPLPDLTEEQTRQAMESIIAQNMFHKDGVNLYAGVKGARYVERKVEDIFEVE